MIQTFLLSEEYSIILDGGWCLVMMNEALPEFSECFQANALILRLGHDRFRSFSLQFRADHLIN